MFWKKLKQTPQSNPTVVVFDFGSTSVKLLLCRYLGDTVEVLGGRKVRYPFHSYSEAIPQRDHELIGALQAALADLISGQESGTVTQAIVGIAGAGVEGYTSQINYHRTHPQHRLSEQEAEQLLSDIQQHADQLMRKMIVWEGGNRQARILNSEILSLTMDGQDIANLTGANGEQLSVIVYHSYVSAPTLKAVMSMVTAVGFQPLFASATMYTVARLIIDHIGGSLSAVIADMGGAATEVAIIQQGRLLGHRPLDIAGHSFTASIAAELGVDIAEAELLKLGFAVGALNDEQMAQLRKIIEYDCKIFLSGVELLMKDFPGSPPLPPQIVLVGGGSLLPGVTASLQSSPWPTDPDGPALITPRWQLKDIPSVRDVSGQLGSLADIPTISLAVDALDMVRGGDGE